MNDLLVAADDYGLPRLRSICEAGLATGEEDAEFRTQAITRGTQHIDLGLAFDAAKWGADVNFVPQQQDAESGTNVLVGHRVVLMARSAFFTRLFARGLEGSGAGRGGAASWVLDDPESAQRGGNARTAGMLQVAVPDSYAAFRSVLRFIYTGHVSIGEEVEDSKTEGSARRDALLEILAAADRYGLTRMKVGARSFLSVPPAARSTIPTAAASRHGL